MGRHQEQIGSFPAGRLKVRAVSLRDLDHETNMDILNDSGVTGVWLYHAPCCVTGKHL